MDLSLLIDFHRSAERQGPGSPETTHKALSFLPYGQRKGLKVADIGCGTGTHTLQLARELNAEIIAVDLFPEFLDVLNARKEEGGLSDKIQTLEASMEALPFEEERLDLIWSEGAIYNMGFEAGLKAWRPFLKSGAYLAVSEITWLSASRPEALEIHWNSEYPEIGTASEKMKILEQLGFSPVGYFVLDEDAWLRHYYQPMEQRFDTFLARHSQNEDAKAIVQAEKKEIALYKEFKGYYSYGFYIARKL
jgi:ubiquinone/menaquinone biosynthesis C-methylase UbiE